MIICSEQRRVREFAFVVVLFGAAASSMAQAAGPARAAACEQHALTGPQRWQTITEAQGRP